ncbi:MAG: hypothetical protein Q4C68_06300 [Moraxella sp.]|nr:hypothetical protein [Moraxella sp.]
MNFGSCNKKLRKIARFARKKLEVDGWFIKQGFDIEKQELAIFYAKLRKILSFYHIL